MTPTAPAPPDLRNTLEEMRASMAAQGARGGLAGAVQDAILKLLEVIITLLLDFRAGRLAALAEAEAGVSVTGAQCGGEETPNLALPHSAGEGAGSAGSHCAMRNEGPIKGRGFRDAGRVERRGHALRASAASVPSATRKICRRGHGRAQPVVLERSAGRWPNAPGPSRAFRRYTPPCRAGPFSKEGVWAERICAIT